MKSKLLLLTTTGLLYAQGKSTTTSRLLSGGGLSGGETNFTAPTHYGDTKHARAVDGSLQSTTNIIHDQLMNGLRQEFDFLHKSITGGGDTEGFVREGIVFCGRTFDDNGAQREDGNLAIPSAFSTDTTSLAVDDGYGGTEAMSVDEKTLCRNNACEEGSFVSTVANRVRSIGYHITHSDICDAKATVAWNVNPILTCQLNGYNGVNAAEPDSHFESYSYDANAAGSGDTWLERRVDCYKRSEIGCTDDCSWNAQGFCAPSQSWIDVNVVDKKYTISRDASTATGGLSANEVRRETAYQDLAGQSVTDKVFVTGVEADLTGSEPLNNCKSLRQYVAALNGLAQINAFRDLGILEGENVWNSLIEEIRQNFNSIAVILNDYYDESTKLFPLIEFEDAESCPMGVTEFDATKDKGTEASPLCTQTDYDTIVKLNVQGEQAQGILRGNCFCRQDPAGTDSLKEADQIYLEYNTTRIETRCQANSAAGASENWGIKGYCGVGDKDDDSWKRFLKELEPVAHKIKVFSGDAAAIYTKLKNTLKLVDDDNYEPTCGRLVSTKKDFATANKGGNCLPFRKLNEVLYRLELDTSNEEQGDLFMLGQVQLVAESISSQFNTIGNSENIGKVMENFDDFQNTVDDAQVHEAAFNVKVAKGLKRAVARDNEVMWLALRDELTSMDVNKIGYSIAEDAAEHFMRITTTDHDDKLVDNNDAEGVNADSENPTVLR